METTTRSLDGLGGWLILVGLGIIFRPIAISKSTLEELLTMSQSDVWRTMTDPASSSYVPLFKEFFMGQAAINIILLGLSLYLAFLFFTKNRQFPKWFIAIVLLQPVVILVSALVANTVFPNVRFADIVPAKELIALIAICRVWIPHMRVSKRVKITFLGQREEVADGIVETPQPATKQGETLPVNPEAVSGMRTSDENRE